MSAERGTGVLGSATNPISDYRWPLLALAIAAFVVFIVLERRSANPLLPRHLIRERVFQTAGIANVLVGAALIVAMVNAPLVVALLSDEDDIPRDSALLLGSFTLAMTAGALAGGRLMQRWSVRLVATAGLLVGAIGFASMSTWGDELRLPLMSITMALAGLGLGIVIAPIGEAAIRAAGRESFGAASGLVLLARLIGMTIGLSVITAYALQRIESRVADLPRLSVEPGETTSQYLARQQEFIETQVIPLTLDVIGETFVVAAVVCLVAVGVATRIRSRAA